LFHVRHDPFPCPSLAIVRSLTSSLSMRRIYQMTRFKQALKQDFFLLKSLVKPA